MSEVPLYSHVFVVVGALQEFAPPAGNGVEGRGWIGILLPNNQRQHRTLHIQKDVLPYALC